MEPRQYGIWPARSDPPLVSESAGLFGHPVPPEAIGDALPDAYIVTSRSNRIARTILCDFDRHKPIFSNFEASLTKSLERTEMTCIHFPEGQVLFSEGHPADSVFRILSGTVDILRELDGEPIPLGRVGAGEARPQAR
jgi:cyclic nucleotide-binding protein